MQERTGNCGNLSCNCIRVADKGIDSEVITHLFQKFVSKSDSGTGLGLYISKNIVEAHGGKIWASNNQNGIGSTFSFSIPVELRSMPDSEPEPNSETNRA